MKPQERLSSQREVAFINYMHALEQGRSDDILFYRSIFFIFFLSRHNPNNSQLEARNSISEILTEGELGDYIKNYQAGT